MNQAFPRIGPISCIMPLSEKQAGKRQFQGTPLLCPIRYVMCHFTTLYIQFVTLNLSSFFYLVARNGIPSVCAFRQGADGRGNLDNHLHYSRGPGNGGGRPGGRGNGYMAGSVTPASNYPGTCHRLRFNSICIHGDRSSYVTHS